MRPGHALRLEHVPGPRDALDRPVRAGVLEPERGAPAVVLVAAGIVGDVRAAVDVFEKNRSLDGRRAVAVADAVGVSDAVLLAASTLRRLRHPLGSSDGHAAAERVRPDRLRRRRPRHGARLEDNLVTRARLHQPPPLDHPYGGVRLEHPAHERHVRELGHAALVRHERQPTGAGDDGAALDDVIAHGVTAPVLGKVDGGRGARGGQPPLRDGVGDRGQHLSSREVTRRSV